MLKQYCSPPTVDDETSGEIVTDRAFSCEMYWRGAVYFNLGIKPPLMVNSFKFYINIILYATKRSM